MKIETPLVSFSPCPDRFVTGGYRKDISFEKKLEMISRLEGLAGVMLDFPTEFKDPVKLRSVFNRFGLKLGTVEIDLFSDPEWKMGSLSSPDGKVRGKAVRIAREGLDAAVEAEAAGVYLWLGHDGYDYSMQVDYAKTWQYLVESIE